MELMCPKCMSLETIKLDVSDGDTLTCSGCDEEYSAQDVTDLVSGWAKVLPWIASHPARQPETEEAAT